MAQASILIIEPETTIVHLFAQLWEEHGYTVACATSQDEARALLAAHGPEAFGVVLSYDFADHAPTPYAWLDQLRAWTRAPIVICTRSPATRYADHQARGYAAVVEEPCDPQEVLDAVAALCSGGPGAIRHARQLGVQGAGHREGEERQTRTGRTSGEAPDSATAALRAELALAGFRPTHLGELRTRPYRDALPILVRWLPRVRDGQTKWALVSALAVPWRRRPCLKNSAKRRMTPAA